MRRVMTSRWAISVSLLLVAVLAPLMTEAGCQGSHPSLLAVSTSYGDVKDCISAADDGDTIIVPPGASSWYRAMNVSKAISIIGNGNGATVITGTGTGILIWHTKATGGSPSGLARLSGFTFKSSESGGGCVGSADRVAMVEFDGSSANVRVDHNRFEATACGAIHLHENVRGVFDHNEVVNIRLPLAHMLIIEHEHWHGISYDSTFGNCCGDGSWSSDSTMGTGDQLTVEDNTFTNQCRPLNDCHYFTNDFAGARVTYRFNIFNDAAIASHGTESGGRMRGFRHWEVYRNQFNWTNGSLPDPGGLRGGTGKLFQNHLNPSGRGSFQHGFSGNTYRRNYPVFEFYPWSMCGIYRVTSLTRSGTIATATHDGPPREAASGGSYLTISGVINEPSWNGTKKVVRTADNKFDFYVPRGGATTATGTITIQSPFDGNTDSTGYPCMDQIGRGKGLLITGTEPAGLRDDHQVPDPDPPQPVAQALEPVYNFKNLLSGVEAPFDDNNPVDVTVQNRDFYNLNTSYNGTSERGIGYGPRSVRPQACTVNDGWWATDQGSWNTSTTETFSALVGLTSGADGVLDICTATGTPGQWADGTYIPFMYPHPLVGAGNRKPPAMPTRLHVQDLSP
jgi:hypothetical protein